MAKQTIGLGTVANDGTGDPLRTAFNKANANFSELYADSVTRVGDRAGLLASVNNVLIYDDATGENKFQLSADQASATDNVLRIERTDGTIVERIWDGVNFWADWIPTGVPVGPNDYTPSATYNAEKIQQAVIIAGETATIHLTPQAEYLCGVVINVTSQNIEGHGATIKQGPQISSLLTAQAEIGAYSVTVVDASAFRTANRALAILTPGTLGGHAMYATFGGGFEIISIVGNVITFAQPLVKVCPIGTKLVVYDNMMFVTAPSMVPTIRHIIFDGNKAVHSDVLDFVVGWAVDGYRFHVEDCEFKNMANECVAIGAGSVRNCKFYDNWGSSVHVSSAYIDDANGLIIENIWCKNVNTKDNGHDEGVITFSNHSRNVRVRDCYFDNSEGTRGRGVFGSLAASSTSDWDDNFQASGIVAKNFGQVISVGTNGAEQNFGQMTLENCVFDDVLTMTLGGSTTAAKTPYIRRAIIRGCEFVNTTFDLRSVRDLQMPDNTYRFNTHGPGLYCGLNTTFSTLPSTRLGGGTLADGDWCFLYADDGGNLKGIYIRASGAWVYDATKSAALPWGKFALMYLIDNGKVSITGGSMAGPGTNPDSFQYGIKFANTKLLKDKSGDTNTWYNQNVLIANIDLIGHQFAVAVSTDPWNTSPAADCSGWRFQNVNVWCLADSLYTNVVGLEVPAGCVADNCQVYLPDTATSALSAAIQLKGPIAAATRLGGIARNCFVPRAPGSALAIRIGNTTDSAANANCVAVNNLVAKAVAQAGSRDAIVSGNTLLDTSTLTGYSAPIQVPSNEIGKQEGLY